MTVIAARHLLRQWDAGQPIWSWRLGADTHLLHHMAFEILRWFLLRPVDLQILERFVADGKTPTGFAGPQFFALMDRLEALPALRNMRPYTAPS